MVEMAEESIQVIAADPADRRLMAELLAESGLRAADGDLREPAGHGPHATIVCHRTTSATPVPILPDATVDRGRVVVFSDCSSEQAVIETLEAGAHHYFDIDEPRRLLQTRLAAALRSHFRCFQSELLVPPFRFDPSKRRVWRDGRPVGLSPKEFDLAFYLFSNRGRTVGNHELMTAVWSLPRTMDSRRIDTAACRVRKKMELDRTDRWYLRRLRGQGYLLTTDTRSEPRREGEGAWLKEVSLEVAAAS